MLNHIRGLVTIILGISSPHAQQLGNPIERCNQELEQKKLISDLRVKSEINWSLIITGQAGVRIIDVNE